MAGMISNKQSAAIYSFHSFRRKLFSVTQQLLVGQGLLMVEAL